MSRLLITGHEGFTGQILWRHLAALGHEPVGFELEGKPIDLRDGDAVKGALKMLRPQRIVHLAAISSVDHCDIRQIYDENLLGTRNLLEAARDLSSPIDAFVVASSANVYGHQAGRMSEASPLKPANDYAVSKAATEMLVDLYKNDLPIITVRPFNYTGLGQSPHFVIAKIVAHLKAGEQHLQLGNLDVARDFSDVRDICKFYGKLISSDEAIGEVYNLCSGFAVELRDILKMSCRISGREIAVLQDANLVRPNDIKELYGDPSKIDRVMGPYRRYSLEETLSWMLLGEQRS